MSKKFLLLVCTLLFFLTVPTAYGTGQSNSAKDNLVPFDEAQLVAQKFLTQSIYRDTWNLSNLSFVEPLYGIEEELLGYAFNVSKGTGIVGHIIVSSTKDRGPILQFGDKGLSDPIEGRKGYLINGIIHAPSAADIFSKAASLGISIKPLAKTPDSSRKEWSTLYSSSSTFADPISKELAVTRVWQRLSGINNPSSSCGPATGTMITNYLKSKGHNVRNSTYYGGNSDLVNHLYTEMKSGIFGTSLTDFMLGLLTHLRHDGERWVATDYRGTNEMAWYAYK
ncbi:Spi family protease inhibitor [Cohnella sp. REN36]|uniref:Spi family protease inhibitor n=1 Tax=Cohnella sp. REN36 TaxID=2887347 RepID=UPI001D13E1E0|nr:Spi family protease inhibitor [Cohnella sp. REN36]MCC3375517.1 Spi family protease inhibitor [Cohnella sp. REN36]